MVQHETEACDEREAYLGIFLFQFKKVWKSKSSCDFVSIRADFPCFQQCKLVTTVLPVVYLVLHVSITMLCVRLRHALWMEIVGRRHRCLGLYMCEEFLAQQHLCGTYLQGGYRTAH